MRTAAGGTPVTSGDRGYTTCYSGVGSQQFTLGDGTSPLIAGIATNPLMRHWRWGVAVGFATLPVPALVASADRWLSAFFLP